MRTNTSASATTWSTTLRFTTLAILSVLSIAWFTERQGSLYATGATTGQGPNPSREACESVPCYFGITVDCEGRIVTLRGSADDGSGLYVDFRQAQE